MQRILLIIIFSFFINKINASSNGNCYLKGVRDIDWRTEYRNDPVDDFEDKEFKRFLIRNVRAVEIRGSDYGKYFQAKLTQHYLILSPTPIFKFFELNEKSTIDPEMNIRLNFQCKTGARQLSFYQPIRDHNTYSPDFNQSSYVYILPMPLPGKFDVSVFGETIIACDLDISNVRLDFEINPTKDFSLVWGGPINDTNKCHKAVLRTNKPLRLFSQNVYQITVKDRGTPSRIKTARIKVYVIENASIPPTPQFESPYYTASYYFENEKYNIIVDSPIRLKNGCSKIELDLLEYKDHFRIYCVLNEIIVELLDIPLNGEWEDTVVVLVTIVATLENSEESGKTVLVLSHPRRNCEEDNISQPQSTVIINFTQNNYSFQVEPSYQGFVGIVKAKAVPEELIEYSIVEEEALINIDKSTGTLKMLKKSDIGTYNFIVHAKGVKSKIRKDTNVTITVLKQSDTLQTMATSILIEHVEENEGRSIKLPCNCNYCSYEIIEQYPETDPKLFAIFSKTQLYAVPIDREMDEIINMKIPQFTLWLVLTTTNDCIRKNNLENNNDNEIFREWVFIPSKIPNASDQMLVSVIIDDDNDNPPVFQKGNKLVIGYPIKTLANVIAPLYLTKVLATDLDVGKNAEILYRIIDNKNFIIHSTTGVIYAGDDAVNDDASSFKFNVIATDRKGFSLRNLNVKPLKQTHMIVLTVKNLLLENLDVLFEKLSNNTGLQVKYLNAAIIPVSNTEYSSSILTRIIVYGLNSEDELVEAHTLENAIVKSTENVTTAKLDLEQNFHGENPESNVKEVYLMVTLVVAVLLVIFVITFLICYYFKIFTKKSGAPDTIRQNDIKSNTNRSV